MQAHGIPTGSPDRCLPVNSINIEMADFAVAKVDQQSPKDLGVRSIKMEIDGASAKSASNPYLWCRKVRSRSDGDRV